MRNKTKAASSILFFFVLIIFISCGQKQDRVEKIMEEGVEVIVNHIQPYQLENEPSKLQLEIEFSIDMEKEKYAELGMRDIWAYNVDSQENIYIWDVPMTKEDLVFMFDNNGKFQNSFLRRGNGPGEIQSPTLPIMTYRNEFIIVDYFPRKLKLFSSNGDSVKEIKFINRIRAAYLLSNGFYLISESKKSHYGDYMEDTKTIYSKELKEIKTISRKKEVNMQEAERIKGTIADEKFILIAISNEEIYTGDNEKDDYEILVFNHEGNLIRKIRKKYTRVDVTDEFKEKVMAPYKNITNELLKSIGNKIYFPKHMSPYQNMFCDDEGHLFVMTYEMGEKTGGYICDIFNADGVFIGRISIGNFGVWDRRTPCDLVITAKNRHLYCMQLKENGYKELVVYRMKWE